jgi:hypothetical protein
MLMATGTVLSVLPPSWRYMEGLSMNWDLAAIITSNAEAVIQLAEAAQRALAGRVLWTPTDAAAAVRAALLPLWDEVSPATVRDTLCAAAGLAVAADIFRAPRSVGSWPTDALLSAELRARNPEPLPGFMNTLDAASMIAFDPGGDAKALEVLSVVMALAYTPGAHVWHRPA